MGLVRKRSERLSCRLDRRVVNVPLFINAGDVIRINTDVGTYAERVAKA